MPYKNKDQYNEYQRRRRQLNKNLKNQKEHPEKQNENPENQNENQNENPENQNENPENQNENPEKSGSKAEVDIKKSTETQTEINNNFKYITPSELFKKNMFDDKNFVSITQLNLIKEERDHYCNLAVDYKNEILRLKQEIEYLRNKK
jgi:hypothetical protein